MANESPVRLSILMLSFLKGIFCSVGDNSPFYKYCVKNCKVEICDAGKHSIYQYHLFGFGFSLWSCIEDCEYKCQWETVEAFQRKNWVIPQFNGKWPFVRFLGFQEPASVFFSILNFLGTMKLLMLFKKNVSKSSPFYYVWNIFALLQLNSWFWSSVYHGRDTDITEKLDYMSAFLVVLYSFYGVGLRIIASSCNVKSVVWSIFCGLLGLNHLSYLWLYRFDYGYNMKLNCILGGITICLWILWSILHFHSQPYVWKVLLFVILIGLTTLLELMDFPPILWLVDAHALWHATTTFVSIFFYMFIIDDCNYLSNSEMEKILTRDKVK